MKSIFSSGKGKDVEASTETSRESDLLVTKPGNDGVKNYLAFGSGEFLQTLYDVFGYKLLTLLFVVQHLQKGFAAAFSGRAIPYVYKAYSVPAPQMQIYGGLTQLPWALKPIIGLCSDMFPVFGYNKAPYILIASVFGAASYLSVGMLNETTLSVGGFVTCLFLIALQSSTCDLLSEAKYAEQIQKHPAHGPSMLTYVWFGLTVGGLVATLLSGPAMHSLGPRSLFLFAAVPAFAVLVPVSFGYLEEKQQTHQEVAEARQRYYEQKEACALCLFMLMGTIFMSVVTITSRDPLINCIAAISVAGVMLFAFSILLSPVIARANAFALIQTALGFSTGGASFYFYTDTKEQYPEGPHFSEFFYNSVLGVSASLVAMLGIYCYQKYMSTWKYRHLLVVTNVTMALLSVLDIMMFARLNVKYGIPDHILVFGLSVAESLVFQWQWMPQVVILSYLCPKGMEATMYALLAGCHNMGNVIASNCGALLLDRLGCRPSGAEGESDQFKNLWVASAISTVVPLMAVLLLIQLIPDAKQNERLVADNPGSATEGSLWKRWTGRA